MNFVNKKLHARKLVLMLFDLLCLLVVSVGYFLINYWLTYRFSDEPMRYFYASGRYWMDVLFLIIGIHLVRIVFRIYSNVYRYADIAVYLKIVIADALGGILAMLASGLVFRSLFFWSFVTITAVNALLCLSSRFVYRIIYRRRRHSANVPETQIPVAIIGAGSAGAALLEDIRYKKQGHYLPMFFIDIDREKVGSRLFGLKVYGEDESVLSQIKHDGIQELLIAINNVNTDIMERLYYFFGNTGCKLKTYDTSVNDLKKGKDSTRGTLRDFSIEDLLFRKPLNVSETASRSYYSDKVVMVTGGGGSIGSELCRQIAKCAPKHLIILDIYENNAYDIQQELIREYGNSLTLSVEIASVRDRVRVEAIFRAYHPEIVFHAAAHKHVPLMEHSACEAIKNNVFGTKNVADMAEAYGVEKFILISTDKAVNPTNVMGASKRMCERVIQCRRDSKTTFAAVRFGNVLGSNGSVIPLFRRQIAAGGPVTITDRRIIRYFMTIPEASQLVMQAGAMAKAGELFVLDMGKPVHIYTLAENMIRLSGLRPHIDIEISEIGLRPGEKLYEELLIKTETLDKTDNNMIFIERDTPPTRQEIDDVLAMLASAVEEARYEIDSERVKTAMKQAVPEFKDPEEINCAAEEAEEMKMTVQ